VTDPVTCVTELLKNGQWFSPLAILLSATVGGIIAWAAVKTNREMARKRATLDVILKSESDEYFERIYAVFLSEKKRSSGLEALLHSESDSERKAKMEVDNLLNHYELIAISIHQNILDEDFYKEWMRSTYVRHYKESRAYINGTRKEHPKVYICFQALAEKWDNEELDTSTSSA